MKWHKQKRWYWSCKWLECQLSLHTKISENDWTKKWQNNQEEKKFKKYNQHYNDTIYAPGSSTIKSCICALVTWPKHSLHINSEILSSPTENWIELMHSLPIRCKRMYQAEKNHGKWRTTRLRCMDMNYKKSYAQDNCNRKSTAEIALCVHITSSSKLLAWS